MIIYFIFNITNFSVIITFLTNLPVSVVLILLNFLTNSSFLLTYLVYLVSNVPLSNLSTLLFKLLKPLGTFFNLSISNLSTSDFKLGKSGFLAKSNVSTHVAFFISVFVA